VPVPVVLALEVGLLGVSGAPLALFSVAELGLVVLAALADDVLVLGFPAVGPVGPVPVPTGPVLEVGLLGVLGAPVVASVVVAGLVVPAADLLVLGCPAVGLVVP